MLHWSYSLCKNDTWGFQSCTRRQDYGNMQLVCAHQHLEAWMCMNIRTLRQTITLISKVLVRTRAESHQQDSFFSYISSEIWAPTTPQPKISTSPLVTVLPFCCYTSPTIIHTWCQHCFLFHHWLLFVVVHSLPLQLRTLLWSENGQLVFLIRNRKWKRADCCWKITFLICIKPHRLTEGRF